MVALHKDFRVSPTIAAESMFRNKISTGGVFWHSVLKTTSHDPGLSATRTLTGAVVLGFLNLTRIAR
jgi:hypothetical protein